MATPTSKPTPGTPKPAEAKKAPVVKKAPTVPARFMSPLEEVENIMERMMERVLGRGFLRPFHWEAGWPDLRTAFEGVSPKLDVIDRDTEVVVRAQVPGVDKKNLEVNVAENLLTIKGTTSHEEKEEKGDFHRREMSWGSFSRTVTLPAEVDETKARASLKDGVLELVLPKVAASRRRSIKVE